LLKISRVKASEIILDAQEKSISKLEVFTATQIEEYRKERVQRISTGSFEVDKILDGGIQTDALTLLTGKFATGKTQLCFQATVNCLSQLKRKVAFIETEPGTFIPERIEEIATNKGLEINLDDIFVFRAKQIKTPAHLFLAYKKIERKIEEGIDIGLICIDSFIAPFRVLFGPREMLPARSREIGRHCSFLQGLAAKHNLAVMMTVQVMGVPDETLMKVVKRRIGIREQMVGGHLLFHSATFSLALDLVAPDIWEAFLFDSSYLPKARAQFVITKAGIMDVKGVKRGKG